MCYNIPMVKTCSKPDCSGKTVGRGLCRKHYVYWYRRREDGPRCSHPGCGKPAYSAGWCATHRNRIKRHGDASVNLRPPRGDRFVDSRGYVQLRMPEHPASVRGLIAEHRVVIEAALGRFLAQDESVHHANGARHDNRPENLELWASSHPAGQRVEDLVQWAQELLTKYQPI